MNTLQVSVMLDCLYSELDYLAAKHGVLKIDTIGDAWVHLFHFWKSTRDLSLLRWQSSYWIVLVPFPQVFGSHKSTERSKSRPRCSYCTLCHWRSRSLIGEFNIPEKCWDSECPDVFFCSSRALCCNLYSLLCFCAIRSSWAIFITRKSLT